jgi:hypothetical protein
MDSAYHAFVAVIETNLREKLREEVRAELMSEIAAEREKLLADDVPIGRSEAARHLGVSVDALDDLRRRDRRFPRPFVILPNRPSWMLRDIWAYRELHIRMR